MTTGFIIDSFYTCAPGAESGPTVGKIYPIKIIWSDWHDGGNYFVDDYVLYNGNPASRKVRLYTLRDGRLIRECWSDPVTGYYKFERLKYQEYHVWSYDHLKAFDPVSHEISLEGPL